MTNSSLNTETMTWEATEALLKLDTSYIGTENYLGMAYFWSIETPHKWLLRELTYAKRKHLHKKLLANNAPYIREDNRGYFTNCNLFNSIIDSYNFKEVSDV